MECGIADMETASSNRQVSLDILRIVSMAAVVVLHTAAVNWYTLDVHGFDWNVLNVYDSSVRWCVPVFVMISGALFLNPEKRVTIKGLWRKNILRIAIIILFWGGVYALLYNPPASYSFADLYAFIKTWLLGHYHMWFLFMIAGLYAVTPLLRCISANKTALDYYIVLSFFIGILFPAIFSFGHFGLLSDLMNEVQIQFVCGYPFYYMLGYKMNTKVYTKRATLLIALIGMMGIVYTAIMTSCFSNIDNAGNGTFYSYLTPNVCVAAMGVFVLGKRLLIHNGKVKKVIIALSSASLGVYLIHPIVINTLIYFGITSLVCTPIFSVPLLAVFEIVVSFACSWAIRKIPYLGRWVV